MVRRSSITSCIDDSDNIIQIPTSLGHEGISHNSNATAGSVIVKRGSVPIVVVESWTEVTEQFLERKWKQLRQRAPEEWDMSRVLLRHWESRIVGDVGLYYPPDKDNILARVYNSWDIFK